MKLIYTNDGEEVQIGDMVDIHGIKHQIVDLTPPHKPSASGYVYVKKLADLTSSNSDSFSRIFSSEGDRYYVGVIGAEWIDREDREWVN